jgi:hypothetical protein
MKYSGGMIIAVLSLFPAAAGAHSGDHAFITSTLAALLHFVSQPDHALTLLAAAGIALYVSMRRSRAGV